MPTAYNVMDFRGKNLNEKLAFAAEDLQRVRDRVERKRKSGTVTREDMRELTEACERTKFIIEKKEAANEGQALLKRLYAPECVTVDASTDGMEGYNAMNAKTLGEFAAHHIAKANIKPGSKFFETAPEFKSAAPFTVDVANHPITDYDKNVYGVRRELMVADLFGDEQVTGNAITFYREGATVEGGPTTVAEGGKKPLTSWDITPVTVALQKIAAHYKESSELLEDAPWMASSIDSRGIHLHMMAVESYLVSQLASTSGIQTGSTLSADGVFAAMTAIRNASGFAADGVVLNPLDYQALRLAKDENKQYLAGGPFFGQYGNGGIIEQPGLWGLRTAISPAVEQGTAFVGAFKLGGSVVRKGGVQVSVSNSNEDDFVKNMVTVLIEERLALAVRYPAAFVKITDSGTTTTV